VREYDQKADAALAAALHRGDYKMRHFARFDKPSPAVRLTEGKHNTEGCLLAFLGLLQA
jgi:hypothetical protein